MDGVCDVPLLDAQFIPLLQSFVDLKTLGKGVRRPTKNHLQTLNYFLKNPGKLPYDFYKECKDVVEHERAASRWANKMADMGFLEVLYEKRHLIKGTRSRYTNPYKLSLSGLFYIIFNLYNITIDDFLLNLLRNYNYGNVLFELFLYPVITKKTLLDIQWDTAFFSIVYSYLKEVCKLIIDNLKIFRDADWSVSYNGKLMRQVFVWHEEAGKFSEVCETLEINIKNFLAIYLKWSRMDDVKVLPKLNENIIEISDKQDLERNSKIYILKDEGRAVLRQNGKKIKEFSVRKGEGQFLIVEMETDKKPLDEQELVFRLGYRNLLLNFITTLRTQITTYQPYYKNLDKDKNFKKALEYLDKEMRMN